MRQAVVAGRDLDTERLERFLPENYHVVGQVYPNGILAGFNAFVIEGADVRGWTLDDYVLPRLASGLIFGKEV